jgi:hypothetical protein
MTKITVVLNSFKNTLKRFQYFNPGIKIINILCWNVIQAPGFPGITFPPMGHKSRNFSDDNSLDRMKLINKSFAHPKVINKDRRMVRIIVLNGPYQIQEP